MLERFREMNFRIGGTAFRRGLLGCLLSGVLVWTSASQQTDAWTAWAMVGELAAQELAHAGQEGTNEAAEDKSPASPKFSSLPGHANYEKFRNLRNQFGAAGRVSDVQWLDDGRGVNFKVAGEDRAFVFESGQLSESALEGEMTRTRTFDPRPRWDPSVGRARQATEAESPDGKWVAKFIDNNVILEASAGQERIEVTVEGTDRRRFGTGCWVYGEELYQSQAMWWSADSKWLVYYEMDEQHMLDYFLTTNNAVNPAEEGADLYTALDIVRYPKAGMPNPNVALHVFDVETQASRKLPFDGPPDTYLFNCRFAPDGRFLVSRTNRWQNDLQVLAVDLNDMSSHVVVSEKQETWQNNRPMMYFTEDPQKFIWETERSQWKHFELRNMDGELLNPLTDDGEYPVLRILRLDEERGHLYYSAFSDPENPLNAHLHRVNLDGSQRKRLTQRNLNHTSFSISPDGAWIMATGERVDHPPITCLLDADGNELSVLAEATSELAESHGLQSAELFKFLADDGETEIYGVLHRPSGFDPQRKYPLLIDVYGGPQSSGPANVYAPSNPSCEFGFLIAKIGNRGTNNRGKAFESAGYMKLGQVDIQDQADGVKQLRQRPYVDAERVGVFGHSYGGYMSALAVLKYPDVFHVAVSGAPVTDWRNYDTIYTERYMRTPQENLEGYNAGSCFQHLDSLRGNLLLVHGLIDDNVHPANTLQLVNELHNKNIRFDIQVFPNNKHGIGGPYNEIRWEYFHEHLRPEVDASTDTALK